MAAADNGKPNTPISNPTADDLLQQLQIIQAQLGTDLAWQSCRDKGRLLISPLVADHLILVVDPRDAFPGCPDDLEDPRPAVVMTQDCYDRSVAILLDGTTTDTKASVTRDLVAYFIWRGVQEGLVL